MNSDTGNLSQSICNLSLSTVAKRRMRTTKEEMVILEDYFAQNRNPNTQEKKAIAKAVQMSDRSVHFWFQNRRAKENKKNKLKGQQPKQKTKGAKRQEQEHEQEQQPDSQERDNPTCGNESPYATRSKGKQPQLPPITSVVPCRERPAYIDISYFFHHPAFGIEESMKQWSDYHHDHHPHY